MRKYAIIMTALCFIFSGCKKKNDEEQYPMLPKFEFVDANGAIINHEPFYDRVGVISVVASWCGPCFRELRELSDLAARYEKLEIVALTYEQSSQIQKVADSMNVRLPIARADSTFLVTLQISTLPTRLLIDRGKIIFRMSGAPSPPDSQFVIMLEKALSTNSVSCKNSKRDSADEK